MNCPRHLRSWPTAVIEPGYGVDHRMQQQVQQPERLLPTARNHYGSHQQLNRPSATVLPLATDQKARGGSILQTKRRPQVGAGASRSEDWP
jgi:hypothetical protein